MAEFIFSITLIMVTQCL